MNINMKQMLAIESLDLQGVVSEMSDAACDEYWATFEDFVEKFPTQEAELKNALKANDILGFLRTLLALKETFSAIHADELVKRCDKLAEDIKNTNKDMAEASLSYFLMSASMLSIEIQMARHKVESDGTEQQTKTDSEDGQKSILAVDDVSFLLSTLRGLLQGTDYKFTGVTSGAAALKYIQNHETDLFLLDIEMPGMNGYELAEKLKACGQTAPIIFLTGNAQSAYVRKAMQVGAADFIVKPVNKEQVLDKIKKHIG